LDPDFRALRKAERRPVRGVENAEEDRQLKLIRNMQFLSGR